MRCSIPVQTACSGVEIRSKTTGTGLNEKTVPTISLSLSIDLPVEELITALSFFQQQHSPQPDEVPTAFDSRKALWNPGVSGGSASAHQEQIMPHQAQQAKRETPSTSAAAGYSNLAPPPGLTSQWETLSMANSRNRIKVTNLVRRLKSQEVQLVFERYVGPIAHCNLVDDACSITFLSSEHAQAAIDRYDGGVLEVRTDKSVPGEALILYPKDGTFRRTVEDRIGPLAQCHLRRGEGWMTLFRGSITKQLKREEALNQIDFKGSLIGISLDVSTPAALGALPGPMEGLVLGGPMVL